MIERLQKSFRQPTYRFILSVIGVSVAVGCLLLTARAQNAGVSAGGKWTAFSSEDKMTGAKKVTFSLPADNEDPNDDRSAQILLVCVDGRLKLGDFRPNTRIGGPDHPSFWMGRPQMEVMVRVDKSHGNHSWNWVNGKFLAMDKDTVREMIGSQIFKIQFRTGRSSQIAEFSPGGLDLPQVKQACGLKPKKPD
jgi:hypothetical protein